MHNKLFRNIINYFSFSRKERFGFYVLTLLLVLIISAPFIYKNFGRNGYVIKENDVKELDSLIAIMESANAPTFFEFDPNRISKDSLLLLGVTENCANNWVKYRSSGGKFYHPEDLGKIYGLDSALAADLSNYVVIGFIQVEKSLKPFEDKKAQHFEKTTDGFHEENISNTPININEARAEDLIVIKGIGKVFSERIIKYRDLLGGFVRLDQLNEVYGLTPEVINRMETLVYVDDQFEPEKVAVNTFEYRDVLRHPYISKEITDQIFKVRNKDKSVFTQQNFKELVDNDSLFFILLPYIEF